MLSVGLRVTENGKESDPPPFLIRYLLLPYLQRPRQTFQLSMTSPAILKEALTLSRRKENMLKLSHFRHENITQLNNLRKCLYFWINTVAEEKISLIME